MDGEIFHFRKWTNWIFWYQNRCFEFQDTWLNYYWDKDDIGKLIRGSINLSSATAQRIDSKTLCLFNDKVTYYLKADSIKDMEDFISRLMELNVSVTDN
ncbi:oxysterol-binding protein 2-like [Pezoporus occidentalis]|uniref:oxysterol-binding protein 2-like n=1 Tax=Pezoporus occidentalis TaxID=407982 RepID=UPI002F91A27E